MLWLLGLALILMLCGWLALSRAKALQKKTGLPRGRLIYTDAQDRTWQPVPKPFYSAAYGLVGKPDYVVETPKGLIPVEIKSGHAPQIPYLGHLLQLAAYCLLIEESSGYTPAHGLLKYADALYEVDFTRELRAELLNTLAEMRQTRLAEHVGRSHNQAGRCAACGFRSVCGEALSSNE
jgi:CRISPR-associated exonuclease Cas4